jgi:DNA-binding NarL/FixJ family response regulator
MYGTHRADAMAAGADAFLVKGCLTDELLAAIEEG